MYKNKILFIISALILLGLFGGISLGVGHYHLGLAGVWGHLLGRNPLDDEQAFVLRELRFPRVIMAILVGGALASGGTVMQAVFRNPLVSPFILGISNGAAMGAALAIMYFDGRPLLMESLAFFGGIGAAVLAYLFSGYGRNTVTLLLFGMIVSSFSGACIGLMQYLADTDHRLPALTFWMLGGLDGITMNSLWPTVPIVVAALGFLFFQGNTLNLLASGDRDALILGIDAPRAKFRLLLAATFMVTTCVAKVGVIGWIGLVVPHIARILVGADNRFVMPLSMIFGGMFLLAADDLARTLVQGEMPVGILTAVIGSPVFAVLLMRSRGASWS